MTGRASVHSTSRDNAFGRIKVETGTTAFSQNRSLRVSEPLTLDSVAAPVMQIEFNSPINFTLVQQTLLCDLGGILYQVYRSEQGTVTAPFNDPIAPIRRNSRTDAPAYTPQISIAKGGIFTPNVGETPVDTIRIRAGENANKATNVSGAEESSRGLPPNSYYIIISTISGIAGAVAGVLELLYDEV